MTLKEKISKDFVQAFKDKDLLKKKVLSMLNSEIKNKEIELGKKDDGLADEDVVQLIMRAIKQRKDSAEQYRSGKRQELADQETEEVGALEGYLPEQISDQDLEKEVSDAISQTGASSKADMGKVMAVVMAKIKGKADGSRVREAVERLLAQ